MSERPLPPSTEPTRAQAEKELRDLKRERGAAIQRQDFADLRWIDPHIERLEARFASDDFREGEDES